MYFTYVEKWWKLSYNRGMQEIISKPMQDLEGRQYCRTSTLESVNNSIFSLLDAGTTIHQWQ